MEPGLLDVYVKHVYAQARLGVRAAERMSDHRRTWSPDFWAELQTFAVSAGNVAKALWGSGREKDRIADRREPLRVALQVATGSALEPVEYRNHVEHMDERIERWWAENPGGQFIDQRFWHPSMATRMDLCFRVFDPSSGTVYFWGVAYPILPVVEELAHVRDVARTRIDAARR